jgi:hypothetical protein
MVLLRFARLQAAHSLVRASTGIGKQNRLFGLHMAVTDPSMVWFIGRNDRQNCVISTTRRCRRLKMPDLGIDARFE